MGDRGDSGDDDGDLHVHRQSVVDVLHQSSRVDPRAHRRKFGSAIGEEDWIIGGR